MQFSSSILAISASAALAFLAAAPQGAAAEDYRVLVQHASQDPTAFCNSWRCNCVNYVPSDSTLSFKGTLCEPGDYSGKNQNTEAKVFCLFTNGSKTVSVDKHVAKASGATIVS